MKIYNRIKDTYIIHKFYGEDFFTSTDIGYCLSYDYYINTFLPLLLENM